MLIAEIRKVVNLRHAQHRAVRRPAAVLLVGPEAFDADVQSFSGGFLKRISYRMGTIYRVIRVA